MELGREGRGGEREGEGEGSNFEFHLSAKSVM